MSTTFASSRFHVYALYCPPPPLHTPPSPGLGKNLTAITVSSSKDSSARKPTTAFCTNRPMTSFTGQFKRSLKIPTHPARDEGLPPHCLNNTTEPGPAAHQPTHRSAFPWIWKCVWISVKYGFVCTCYNIYTAIGLGCWGTTCLAPPWGPVVAGCSPMSAEQGLSHHLGPLVVGWARM